MKIKEFKSNNIEKKLVRNPNSNKGDYGHVLVIAGNLGFGGAALLSSKAVLASGAGLATLATRKDHLSAALAYCPEVMSKIGFTTCRRPLSLHLSLGYAKI